MKIDETTIKKIADLARIKLTDKEIIKFTTELESILEYANQLQEIDISDVDYVSHIDDFQGEVLADDETTEAMKEDAVFKNSDKRRQGHYFKTSKIL